MVVCRDFTSPGGCQRGSNCPYEHVQPLIPRSEVSNTRDLPKLMSGLGLHPSTAPTPSAIPHVPCRFYAQGACRFGDRCRFQHYPQEGLGSQQSEVKHSPPSVHNDQEPPIVETISRAMAGASVTFGDGAQVLSVDPATTSAGSNMLINVKCTWYQPSKTAVLEFSKAADAGAALMSLTASEIKGRNPRNLSTVRDNSSMQSLRIGNLHVETQEELLRDVCKDHQPLSVIFGEPSYSSTCDKIGQTIAKELCAKGTVTAWELTESKKKRAEGIATFASTEEAQTAVKTLDGYRLPQLGGSRISVSLMLTVGIPILRILWQRLRANISEIALAHQSEGHLDIRCCANPTIVEKFRSLNIVSDSVQPLAKAKAAVEKILAGHTAKSGQDIIWLDFFSKREGITYLRNLGIEHDVFIYSNKTERLVSLYGKVEKMTLVESILAKFVTNIRHSSFSIHTIELNSADWPTGTNDLVYNELVARFGSRNVRFKAASQLSLINRMTLLGTSEDADRAKWIVRQLNGDAIRAKSSTTTNKGGATTKETECAVCYDPVAPNDIYTPPCGHIYDHACFISQARYADSPSNFPLRCLGAASQCDTILSLTELQSVLSRDVFDALLTRSFAAHLRAHPTKYRYCPTAGCETIYHPTDDGKVVTCPACLTAICTTCHIASHEGLTCAQYQKSLVEDPEFAEWKQKTGARACPKCGAVIIKEDGCNHVQCAGCGGHMCWRCGEGFDASGAVYAHLGRVHGGAFGDGEGGGGGGGGVDGWGVGADDPGLVAAADPHDPWANDGWGWGNDGGGGGGGAMPLAPGPARAQDRLIDDGLPEPVDEDGGMPQAAAPYEDDLFPLIDFRDDGI